MRTRLLHILVILIALPTWVFGLLLPLGWLTVAAAAQLLAPAKGPALSSAWQLKLCASSILLMFLSATVAMTLATAAAYAFARIGRLAVVWITAGMLVVPPMVYGYLWLLTLGNRILLRSLPVPLNLPVPNLGNLALAGWSIGLWLWPIPAILLTAGWRWTGRPAWLVARMDAGDMRAFLRAALPAMRPYLVGAAALCLLLAAQEYAIPALFSVQTWQTQYLALAQAGLPLGKLAIASWPAATLLLVLVLLLVRFWRSVEALGPSELGTAILRPRARLYAWSTLLLVISLATIVPAAGAIRSLTKPLQFNAQRFHDELADTPVIMAGAATLALAAALLAVQRKNQRRPNSRNIPSDKTTPGSTRNTHHTRKRITLRGHSLAHLMLGLAVLSWILPTGLIAEGARQAEAALVNALFATGQSIAPLGTLLARYDIYEPMNLLTWVSVLAGRMLPIAWLLVAMVARSLPAHLDEQAAVDGADRWQTLQRVLLPVLAPAAAAGWLICALLVATDTVAATMLQPPGFAVLAVSMLNQMHYGRDGNIVATCLVTLAAAALAATAAALTLGRTASGKDAD